MIRSQVVILYDQLAKLLDIPEDGVITAVVDSPDSRKVHVVILGVGEEDYDGVQASHHLGIQRKVNQLDD